MKTPRAGLDDKTTSFLSTHPEKMDYGGSNRKMQFLQDGYNECAGNCKVQVPEVRKTRDNPLRKMQALCRKIHLS